MWKLLTVSVKLLTVEVLTIDDGQKKPLTVDVLTVDGGLKNPLTVRVFSINGVFC